MPKESWEEIARLRPRIFKFIVKLNGRSDAEDLTQRTILLAMENLLKFRNKAALSTWVLGIAFNIVRSHRKECARNRQRWVDEEMLTDIPANQENPSDAFVHQVALSRIAKAVAALPEDFREALVLVAFEDLSYEQAAEVAGVPVGTIRSRVFRARQVLKFTLAENAWPV